MPPQRRSETTCGVDLDDKRTPDACRRPLVVSDGVVRRVVCLFRRRYGQHTGIATQRARDGTRHAWIIQGIRESAVGFPPRRAIRLDAAARFPILLSGQRRVENL